MLADPLGMGFATHATEQVQAHENISVAIVMHHASFHFAVVAIAREMLRG